MPSPNPSRTDRSLSSGPDPLVWKRIDHLIRWRFVLFMVAANMAGALICTVYFLYFDKMPLPPPAVRFVLLVLGVMTPLLVIMGIYLVRNRLLNVLAYVKNRQKNQPPKPGVRELGVAGNIEPSLFLCLCHPGVLGHRLGDHPPLPGFRFMI